MKRIGVIVIVTMFLAGCWTLNTTDGNSKFVTTDSTSQPLTSPGGNHYTGQNLVFNEISTCSPFQSLSTAGNGDVSGDTLDFKVLSSGFTNYPQCIDPGCNCPGAPHAFPNIVRGTGSYAKTASSIGSGGQVKMTFTGDTSGVATGDRWDFIADIWFSSTTTANCSAGGCKELELWMTSHNQGPAGTFQSTGTYGGISMDVYTGSAPDATYKFHTARTSLSSYDINAIVADAEFRGIVPSGWFLNNISTGFELWNGGTGLQYQALAVCVTGHGC